MFFPSSSRFAKIVSLALPIIGGMLSQNFLNLVDTLMVGKLGDQALAGVGIASFIHFLCTAFITGMGTGVQTTVSRRVGQGETSQAAVPLNGGLLLAWAIGLPLSLLLMSMTPFLVKLVAPAASVSLVAIPYLQMRFLGLVALAMNFSYRGYWNGVGKSRVYFRTIVVTHITNVLLNYLLIFGKCGFPEMGATGAGLASSLAFWVGTIFYLLQALALARPQGFLQRLPSMASVRALFRLSLPTGVQQTAFAGGMTVFFAILARVGTAEVAASNVLVNLLLVVILPSIGFGLASATLVGQALGREEPADARLWGVQVAAVGLVMMAVLGAVGALVPRLLLAPFLVSPSTLALAEAPLRLVAVGLPLDAVGIVLMHSMLGAGYAKRVMLIGVALQWGLQLPLVLLVALVFKWGLLAVWCAHLFYRMVQTAAFVFEWRRGHWQSAQV